MTHTEPSDMPGRAMTADAKREVMEVAEYDLFNVEDADLTEMVESFADATKAR